MRRRVFVVAGEYSANPRFLPPARRGKAFFTEPHPEPSREELARAFFRFPNRRDDGRTHRDDWEKFFGISEPVGLTDLFASAAHRAVTTLDALCGGSWRATRDRITDLYVTSMPGLDVTERMNIGLVPQALRATLGLGPRTRSQFVVGTSDSGAWAFAQAVRAARNAEQPATILVVAGQVIPSGYVSQYQIRTVLGADDQARGLDMLAVGDLLMDEIRRNAGVSRAAIEELLGRVATRKAQAGIHYPAGINAGRPHRRDARRTPYFDAADMAPPCCGAAATIVTSDERLLEQIAAGVHPRFGVPPITEVLGVGEGSSNATLLQRMSPLTFATSIREALADAADDARVPLPTLNACAFAVLHDAFPSIELSFLLALGLGWERSAERMAEGWSNPFGGLLSFGHALGASGLVQVNKTHHLFSEDRRYLEDGPGLRRLGFREGGALSFSTSVGGPLSHIVGTVFHGGARRPWPAGRVEAQLDAQSDAQLDARGAGAGGQWAGWRARRHQLRHGLRGYLEGVPGAWLLEGATWVSIRSCLKALGPEDLARLEFDGLEELVLPERLEEVRRSLRTVLAVVRNEGERLTMFDAFRLLTDEVRELAGAQVKDGWLRPEAAGLGEEKLADRLKECLRVPLAVFCRLDGGEARREVRFLPCQGLRYEGLDEVHLVSEAALRPLPAPPDRLPFWNARATRPELPAAPLTGTPDELVAGLVEQPGGPSSAAELRLLRRWFAPGAPPSVLQAALRAAGATALPPAEPVRAIFWLGELVADGVVDPGAAGELVGRAAREALGFLGAFETSLSQVGTRLSLVAIERPPVRNRRGDTVIGAVRFAREASRAALEHGIVLRSAIAAGEGEPFEDASGRPCVASTASGRAAELLEQLAALPAGRPLLALDGASPLIAELLTQRLPGWEPLEGGPPGAALWRCTAG